MKKEGGVFIKKPEALKTIYYILFDEEFNCHNFDNRLKLQKAIYLLENLGMSIGEYGYFWYKFGPHSQDLQDDAFKTKEYSKKEVELTKKTKEKISHFNKIINYKPEEVNDIEDWLEIVASIHYLLDIFPSRKRQKNEIIRRFEFKKGMDIEHDVLEEAYELVMNIWDFNIGEEERIET